MSASWVVVVDKLSLVLHDVDSFRYDINHTEEGLRLKGSCLCEQIQFEASGLVTGGWGCSCDFCRKFTGTAFAMTVTFLERNFHWKKGEQLLSRFEKLPGTGPRCFCSICGSPMPSDPKDGLVELHISSLDEEPEVSLQVFLHDLPDWAGLLKVIPVFQNGPDTEFHVNAWKKIEADYEKALNTEDEELIQDIREFAGIVQRIPEFEHWWKAYRSRFGVAVQNLLDY